MFKGHSFKNLFEILFTIPPVVLSKTLYPVITAYKFTKEHLSHKHMAMSLMLIMKVHKPPMPHIMLWNKLKAVKIFNSFHVLVEVIYILKEIPYIQI